MADQTEHDLRQGAKAAAAAAAVAAAAGVARAIASHAHDASRSEEPHEAEEPTAVEEPEEREEAPRVTGTGVSQVRAITERARSILEELSGIQPETVSAVERTPNGWQITLEAVELRRVPDSTDVLATYDVELDGDGELVRYERRRRYSRSQSDDGGSR